MDFILFSFALLAGIQAFFAPCSIALIPAYIGYYISEENQPIGHRRQLLYGLKAGGVASLGLISIYAVFGIILTILGKLITPVMPWIELSTGTLLLFLGVSVLLGYKFALRPPVAIQTRAQGTRRFYFFGIAYALGAIGCTLPLFLLVIFQALAQKGMFGGFINFIAYALAMATLMIVFSLIAAVSKTAISRFMKQYMLIVQKSAGVLVLFAGVYMLYLALKVITI